MIAYKIVEYRNGGPHALFHGTDGSRRLPVGQWMQAEVRPVRDGSGDRWYLSGWHALPTMHEALSYLTRFRSDRSLGVVEVELQDTWPKEHSPQNVILARWMRITGTPEHEEQ